MQGPETLDMNYNQDWCVIHGTTERLEIILASLPVFVEDSPPS